MLITLSGAPLTVLAQDGRWSAVQSLQDTQIFRSAGFELLEHLHLDQVQPNLTTVAAERHFARILDCVRRHFSASAAHSRTRTQLPITTY